MVGDSEVVKEAVDAAGGFVAVAFRMGFKTDAAVMRWVRTGRVPHYHIDRLCELGGNKVQPARLREVAGAAA